MSLAHSDQGSSCEISSCRPSSALSLLCVGGADAGAQKPPSADQVFQLRVAPGAAGELLLNWSISPGNYLYRDKIAVTTPGGSTIEVSTDRGEIKDDPSFGQTEIYRNHAHAAVAAKFLPQDGNVIVSFQGCAEKGICYPPVKDDRRSADDVRRERKRQPRCPCLLCGRRGSERQFRNSISTIHPADRSGAGTGAPPWQYLCHAGGVCRLRFASGVYALRVSDDPDSLGNAGAVGRPADRRARLRPLGNLCSGDGARLRGPRHRGGLVRAESAGRAADAGRAHPDERGVPGARRLDVRLLRVAASAGLANQADGNGPEERFARGQPRSWDSDRPSLSARA